MLGMMTACPILGCDSLSLHQWWTCSVHYLILAECHLMLDPYVLNAWLSCTGSKNNCTLPLALCTNTKLLYHSAVSSTPSSVMMSNSCSH